MLDEGFLWWGVEGDNPAPEIQTTGNLPHPSGSELAPMGICPYRQSERRIRGGWEEAGTLAPRAATVLWELQHQIPEFPILILEQSSKPEEAGTGPAPEAGSKKKGQREGEAVWPGLPLPASPGPWEGHERHWQGQAPCRAQAQATGQKVAGPEVSVPTDISVRCQGA